MNEWRKAISLKLPVDLAGDLAAAAQRTNQAQTRILEAALRQGLSEGKAGAEMRPPIGRFSGTGPMPRTCSLERTSRGLLMERLIEEAMRGRKRPPYTP